MSMFKRLRLDRGIDAKLFIAVMAGIIVAGGLLLVGGVAFGTVPDANGHIQACFKTVGGQLRVLDTDTGDTCNRGETAISWSQGGSETGEVPQGGMVFFDSADCPAGWSEYTPARGRTVVGLQPGGNLNGTVGSAFTDEEDRAHQHGLTSFEPNHSHSSNHSHSVNPPNTSTTSFSSTSRLLDGGVFGTSRWLINDSQHNHSVNIPSFSSGLASFLSGSAGGHGHSAGNPRQTSSVIPYLQLLSCEKD